MKIEIKNLKVNLEFSEETIMFKADIFIDGVKSCYAENQGIGGSTHVGWYNEVGKILYNKAEEYLSTQPPIVHSFKDETWEVKQTLETFVDDYVDDYVKKKDTDKFLKKMNKDMLKGIVISNNGFNSYRVISWKNKTIQDILSIKGGDIAIKNEIQKAKNDGYAIYNTNIPSHILN